MFGARTFQSRFFAASWWGKAQALTVLPSTYFAARHFGSRYFAARMFRPAGSAGGVFIRTRVRMVVEFTTRRKVLY